MVDGSSRLFWNGMVVSACTRMRMELAVVVVVDVAPERVGSGGERRDMEGPDTTHDQCAL